MTEPVTTPLRSDKRKTNKSATAAPGPSFAQGHGGGGLRTPVLAGAVELPLGGVLTLRVGPADVEAVDADAVPAVGVRSVWRRPGQWRHAALRPPPWIPALPAT